MARRYTYSRTIKTEQGFETFTAHEFDSFDEAKRAVAKGVHEHLLELKEKAELNTPEEKKDTEVGQREEE